MAESSSPRVNMRIEAVRVTGFRALREVCVTLDPSVTVLVGENNTGKSAFLEALSTALGQRTATPDDLHIDAQGRRFKDFSIDILLVPTDGKDFDGQLTSLYGEAIFSVDNRKYVAIRTSGSLGEDRSTINRTRCFIEEWIGCHTSYSSEGVEISGEPVSARHLTPISFALLEANRDLVDEMRKRSSRWGRLLAQHDLDLETIEEIENQLAQMGERILNESQVLGRLSTRLDTVQNALPTVNQVKLEPLPGRIDDLTRATDILINTSGGPRLPLRMQGLGSRSLAKMMVYTAFASELSGIEEPYSPHPLSCFEEPEAHLHPQAQRSVMHIVSGLEGQCIVTTHSPQISSEIGIKQVRLFRRSNSGIEVRSSDSLTEEKLIKARHVIERSQGQVFFARLAIIVEGTTEYDSLPVFAQAYWGKSPESKGVTFVDAGSLAAANPLIKILEDLNIPWLVFVDGDGAGCKALGTIGNMVGRILTPSSREVVMLPNELNYEQYLISEGLQEPIKRGIDNLYGAGTWARYKDKRPQLTEDQSLEKYLKENKGTYGAPIAKAVISAPDKLSDLNIPNRVVKLLKRADSLLEVN